MFNEDIVELLEVDDDGNYNGSDRTSIIKKLVIY